MSRSYTAVMITFAVFKDGIDMSVQVGTGYVLMRNGKLGAPEIFDFEGKELKGDIYRLVTIGHRAVVSTNEIQ